MKENLIVIQDTKIAFSRYYTKPNGIPTIVGWTDFMDRNPEMMTLPIGRHGFLLLGTADNDIVLRDQIKTDPSFLAITITAKGRADEFSNTPNNQLIPISSCKGSFYCRSGSWAIETAATAAQFVYEDVEDIYRAAMKTTALRVLPFYTGDLRSIGRAFLAYRNIVKSMNETYDEVQTCLKEEKDTPESLFKKLDDTLKESNAFMDDFEAQAKLTLHPY